jgi:hypothetical protein
MMGHVDTDFDASDSDDDDELDDATRAEAAALVQAHAAARAAKRAFEPGAWNANAVRKGVCLVAGGWQMVFAEASRMFNPLWVARWPWVGWAATWPWRRRRPRTARTACSRR